MPHKMFSLQFHSLKCLAFCAALYLNGAEWHDPTLPQADPDKPVLQAVVPGVLGIGGLHKKVRIPSEADIAEQLKLEYELKIQAIAIAEIKRGSFIFLIGCIVAGLGVVLHFIVGYPALQRASEWVLAGGLCFAGIGLVVKKAAQYQNFIVLGLVVVLVSVILYKCRKWSISHLIKAKKAKPNDTTDS